MKAKILRVGVAKLKGNDTQLLGWIFDFGEEYLETGKDAFNGCVAGYSFDELCELGVKGLKGFGIVLRYRLVKWYSIFLAVMGLQKYLGIYYYYNAEVVNSDSVQVIFISRCDLRKIKKEK
jgi:hypothetical protein